MSPETTKLFNKYRPQSFSEVIGQEISVAYLKGLIKSNNYTYAKEIILYSSIGGVAKTTLAKIYAKAVNCDNISSEGEPCNICQSCKDFDNGVYKDYLELDGAEYNTVDSVTSIIQLASFCPHKSKKFRIIVINEIQRMSQQAQSKFLDLLEFKDNRTIFIFTTTNLTSIIQPFQSRCALIEILPVKTLQILELLIKICSEENVAYTKEALIKIVDRSQGSVRDAIKTLDLCILSFGNAKNFITSTSSYDIIANILVTAQISDFNDIDLVNSVISNNLYRDICRVIVDLELYSAKSEPKFVSNNVADFTYKTIGRDLPNISRVVMQYKPSTHEDFFLICRLLRSESRIDYKSQQNPAIQKGRRFIVEENNKDLQEVIFEKYGFSQVK